MRATLSSTTAILALLLVASCSDSHAEAAPAAVANQTATAVFAAGCFWCVEEAFEKVPGVSQAVSGYSGGRTSKPTYKQVSAGGTGHYEAVQVRYDPSKVSYAALLNTFWRNVDPLDASGQFCDRGESYRGAIFVATPEQRREAQAAKERVAAKFNKPVATPVLAAATFYPAEGYHQDYYKKNGPKYRFYKWKCGRAQRLASLWGTPGARAN